MRVNLALCMWETPTQLYDEKSYVILSFSPEGKTELRVPNLKEKVSNTKKAVSELFGFNDPPKLSGEMPRPSLKNLLRKLNPIDLLNPKHIPSSVIMPKNTTEIFLCMEIQPDKLELGLIDDNNKTATLILENDKESVELYMSYFGRICAEFFWYGSIQNKNKETLEKVLFPIMNRLSSIQND